MAACTPDGMVATTSRARTSFSSAPVRISATPASTAAIQASSLSEPVCRVAPAARGRGRTTAPPALAGTAAKVPSPAGSAAAVVLTEGSAAGTAVLRSQRSSAATAVSSLKGPSSNVNCVSQTCPSRTPTTISGTISRDSWAEVLENAKEPKATGPVPGSSTESATSASRTRCRHQMSASRNRSGPVAVNRAISPKPARPASLRVQQRTSSRTKNAGSPPGKSFPSRGTVRVRNVLVMMRQHYSGVPDGLPRPGRSRNGTNRGWSAPPGTFETMTW